MTPDIIQYIGYGILIISGFLGIGGAVAIIQITASRAKRAELAETHRQRLELAEKTGEAAQLLLVDKEMADDVRGQLNAALEPPPPPPPVPLPPKPSAFGRLVGSISRAFKSDDGRSEDP